MSRLLPKTKKQQEWFEIRRAPIVGVEARARRHVFVVPAGCSMEKSLSGDRGRMKNCYRADFAGGDASNLYSHQRNKS